MAGRYRKTGDKAGNLAYGRAINEAKIEHTPMKPKTVGRYGGHKPATRALMQDAGLLAGTSILTLDGELPVEHLTPDDRIITRDAGAATLRDVQALRLCGQAVRISGGTLGDMRPDRDLIVPAAQPLLVRDWRAKALTGRHAALIPARELVDGEFIRLLPAAEMTLYQLVMDAPHVIYADGMELAVPSWAPAAARAA